MHASKEVISMVIAFAVRAHTGQMRKYSNQPYIEHPVRVMELCRPYTDDISVCFAAILHDVLEDTPVEGAQIEDFIASMSDAETARRTLQLVTELTDVYTKESHPKLNRRSRKSLEAARMAEISGDAQTIKYGDIIDNCDVAENDPAFARVYLRESQHLLSVMLNGRAELRLRAIALVSSLLDRVTNHPRH